MKLISQRIKQKFERIIFVYGLLDNLKGMFWLCVALMFLIVAWDGVILATVATFLQSLVDTTKFSGSTFESGTFMADVYGYFKLIPEDHRILIGFVFTTVTILVGNIIKAGMHTFQTKFATKFIINVRCRLFGDLYRNSLTYFDNNKKGALITMVVNESRSCYSVLKSFLQLFIEVLRGTILISFMCMISVKLTVLVAFFGALFFLETGYVSKILKRLSVIGVERTRALTVDADEGIQGVKLVKLFNLYDMMEASFRDNCWIADSTNRKQAVIMQWQGAIGQSLMLISIFVLIYVNMRYSLVAISLMLTYFYTLQKLNVAFQSINQAYGFLNREIPRLDRIMEFIQNEKIYAEKSGEEIRDVLLDERIVFRNVYLRYESDNILKDINLEICKGQVVALVGESGSGKTSLANLLPRLYDPSEGEIIIDGVNIQRLDLSFLRDRIGLVNQDNIIFNKTVRKNIMIGREKSSEEDMILAAKNAHAHGFVMQLPEGYDTPVGDKGAKLSGGQRQRINIAQIFLKDPEIMILDEATSALDTKSEQYIQKSVRRISKGCTSIIIAHRLSTVRHADKVVVLDSGRITEEGNWDSLMNDKGVFYDMVQRQFFTKAAA